MQPGYGGGPWPPQYPPFAGGYPLHGGRPPMMMGPPMGMPPMGMGPPPLMMPPPPQQMGGMGMDPPLGVAPGGPPGRSTTLWVGRIAPTVEAPFIVQLLEACGPLQEWKPVNEPESGKFKGFGFVTYAEAEGVVVALQVLQSLKLDGQELALKCNKATEEYLAWYKANKQQQQQAAEKQKGEGGGGKDEAADGDAAAAAKPDAADAENAALGRVMELISQRPAVAGVKADTAPSAAAAADSFLSNLSAPRDQAAAAGEPLSADCKRERERDREAEREVERERQRLRREEQRKAEADERASREALRQWEDHERLRQRELEKERDRQADLVRERARQVHADSEAADTDDEEEPWRRRPYSSSRRAAERRRRRDLEQQDDEADRQRHKAELEAAAAEAASRPALDAKQQASPGSAGAFDADDTIMQAMLAAVKSKPEPAPAAAAAVAPAAAQPAAAPGGGAKRKTRAAFVEEEEEDKPKRRLIPIRYSDAELKALQEPAEGQNGGAAQPAAAPQPVDPVALKKQLLGLIPKDKAGAFAFTINWSVLDNAPADVKDKISGWVSKKVGELLGEEPSFCKFILEQLAGHVSAQAMLEALGDVLDEDAESFTLKLWQILIYEQLKLVHGHPK